MNITAEHLEKIKGMLRDVKKEIEIAELAKNVASEYNQNLTEEDRMNPNAVFDLAMVMNIGETAEDISWIYDKTCNWREHPEAIKLNEQHGEYSVKMLEQMGINLTAEEKKEISGHSKKEFPTLRSKIIKGAEVCVACNRKRMYRGEEKEESSYDELKGILLEEGIPVPVMSVLMSVNYHERQEDERSR